MKGAREIVVRFVLAGGLLVWLSACVSVLPTADEKMRAKKYDEAVGLYQQHLAENPDDVEPRARLGYAYLKGGNLGEAVKELKMVLQKVPGHPHAVLYLGQAFYNQKEYAKAREVWQTPRAKKVEALEEEIQRLSALMLVEESQRAAKEAIRNEDKLQARTLEPNAIAVSHFQDASIDKSMGPYQKGLVSMVITYLSKVRAVKVVEREKLSALLSEMQLAKVGVSDPATAPRLGRLLGVENLVVGAVDKGSVKVTTTLAGAGDGKIKGNSVVTVDEKNFFEIPTVIVRDLVKILQVPLSAEEEAAIGTPFTKSHKAFVLYGQALDAFDEGNYAQAKDLFTKALEEDSEFNLARWGVIASRGAREDESINIVPLMIMNDVLQPGGGMMGGGFGRHAD